MPLSIQWAVLVGCGGGKKTNVFSSFPSPIRCTSFTHQTGSREAVGWTKRCNSVSLSFSLSSTTTKHRHHSHRSRRTYMLPENGKNKKYAHTLRFLDLHWEEYAPSSLPCLALTSLHRHPKTLKLSSSHSVIQSRCVLVQRSWLIGFGWLSRSPMIILLNKKRKRKVYRKHIFSIKWLLPRLIFFLQRYPLL